MKSNLMSTTMIYIIRNKPRFDAHFSLLLKMLGQRQSGMKDMGSEMFEIVLHLTILSFASYLLPKVYNVENYIRILSISSINLTNRNTIL